MGRFSDDELREFRNNFNQHVELYNQRVKTDDARHEQLLVSQELNAKQLQELISSTKDIIGLYTDIKGAARIGMAIQRFGLWLAKWGVIGGVMFAAYEWLIKRLPPPT